MVARRDDGEDRLPLAVHPRSNGEYAPLAPSELVREAVRRAMDQAEANARRVGVSRRAFLRSTAGMATVLAALAACNREQAADRSRGSAPTPGTASRPPIATTTTGAPGGTFALPPDATIDSTVADSVLAASEGDLVVDVQTHLLEYPPGTTDAWGLAFPQATCGDDPAACMGIDAWLDLVLGSSDTTVAVLSAIPVVADPDPLSAEVMDRARRQAEQVGCVDRVLMQGHATPSLGERAAALDAMAEVADRFPIAAWKAYTHAGGPPWRLDDDTGAAFCDQVRSLGQRIVCVHKGFGGADASPADVGPAAVAHPDLAFCVYHSGFEPAATEGPYPGDEAGRAAPGVDRLIASCRAAGVGPGGNVYAELGSTWWNLIQRPDEAAHVLGKLLVAFGPDNVLWGTDSIWYGSPQSQIEAFRAFEISEEYQDVFGYPALTPAVKAKILGANAASLYGIDPALTQCQLSPADRAGLRAVQPASAAAGPTSAAAAAAVFAADHPWDRWTTQRRGR